MKRIIPFFLMAICAGHVIGQESAKKSGPTFTSPPTVKKGGGGSVISFAVSEPTDVEVAIVGANGKVIRHLAAGMLGKNAPAPLKADSLQQEVAWDGNDDLKKPASGSFTARVRLGMIPKFDKMLGSNVAELGPVISAIACGPTGELFVFHSHGCLHGGDNTSQCSVYSREGKYLRTILPFPANLPPDKLQGLKSVKLEDGSTVPYMYGVECRQVMPGTSDWHSMGPVISKDGRVIFSSVLEPMTRYPQPGPVRLTTIGIDGSVPKDGLQHCQITTANSGKGAFLALSPDEQTIYATGLTGGGKDPAQNHVVFKCGWNDKQPQVFAGKPGEAGNSDALLNNPGDVATDKNGNVYVADCNNDRVAVFAASGKFIAALKVEKPARIKVNQATGVVYTLGGPGVNVIQKFKSYSDATPLASLTIGTFKHEAFFAMMALDSSATTPVLWFANTKSQYSGYALLRVEDTGAAFSAPVEIAKPLAGKGIGNVMFMEYNKVTSTLVANSRPYDPAKDAFGAGVKNSLQAAGLDGNYYSQLYGNWLIRFDKDMKPFPFPTATDKNGGIHDANTSNRVRGRGIAADPDGNIYMIWQEDYNLPAFNHVHIHNPDGSVKKQNFIYSEIRSVNSIRVDYQGNVYVALGLRPGTERVPKGLQGQVPDDPKDPGCAGGLNSYPMMYGSIVKFGPEGGQITKDKGGVACNYAFGNPAMVDGAKWIYSGSSPVPSWRTKGTPDICLCESSRFDVDGYGRSFFPDAGRFRVGVIDTNGNEVTCMGSYGNADSAGPGSAIPVPEIPLYWPYAVGVGDDVVYIGDRINRRVVQVKLVYAAEKTAPIGN